LFNGARTVNWCHHELKNALDPDQLAEWQPAAAETRRLLVTLIQRYWSVGTGKSHSPAEALKTCELLRDAMLVEAELNRQALEAATELLSDIVHSIIDVFRTRTASLPSYPSPPGLLDSASAPDIPQANILASKSVQLLSSLLGANERLSGQERQRSGADVTADTLGYLQALRTLDVIQEVSAVSVCNVFAGQTASYASSFLQISTAFVSNQNLADFVLVSTVARGLASVCHKARDVAQCCANSNGATSSCCFDDGCDAWASPQWVDGPATLIMPTNPAGRDAFAYEVQLAQSKGNAFDATELLSGSTVLMAVRKQDTVLMLPDGKRGDTEQDDSQERILRMPISKEAYQRAIVDSQNTAAKAGLLPACVVWDEDSKGWANTGIRQGVGLTPIHKMCTSNASASGSYCFYHIECYTTRSRGVFAVAQAEMDCEGMPLGDGRCDLCDVCKGDNSTCSGCDNMPNVVYDGLVMTKGCSGHGQCNGLMCR